MRRQDTTTCRRSKGTADSYERVASPQQMWDTEIDAISNEADKVVASEEAAFAALQNQADGDEELFCSLRRIDDADLEHLVNMYEDEENN